MRIAFLIFALSLGSLVLWPILPSVNLLALLGALIASLLFLRAKRLGSQVLISRILLPLALGCVVANFNGYLAVSRLLPPECSHQSFQFTGVIVGLPKYQTLRAEQMVRFEFIIDEFEQSGLQVCPALAALKNKKVKLNWYANKSDIEPGEVWQFTAKLTRPRGQSNPFGADYQLALMTEGVAATGSVAQGVKLNTTGAGISGLRFHWRQFLQAQKYSENISALLIALTVGDTGAMPSSVKSLMMRTGTSHLIAISGLHVGTMALCGYWFGRFVGALLLLLSLKFRAEFFNGRVIASLVSLLFAGVYSALSGFALPTQRALIMVALFLFSKLVAKYWSLLDVWLYALVFVLLLNPLQAADGGFYLSFTAVLVLVLTMSSRRFIKHGIAYQLQLWLRPQAVIFFGLLPLSIYLFGGLSLVSVLANSIAIPWVTIFSVPLSLASFFLWALDPQWSEWSVMAAGLSLSWLLSGLMFIDQFFVDLGWLTVSISRTLLLTLLACVLVLLLPAPSGLKTGVFTLFALLWFADTQLRPVLFSAERRVTVFDVGQGLAVLIEADGQRLLYDSGPPLGEHTDAFSQAIWPYLQAQGASTLDALVVSHNDADHAGGVKSISERLALRRVYAGEPKGLAPRLSSRATPIFDCNRDSVDHMFVIPFSFKVKGAAAQGNDASCIMLIEFPELQILLPGDISGQRESALDFSAQGSSTALKLLLVPHHGSKSSSSYLLLQQFWPDIAIISAGFQSPYGHPHADVLHRLQSLAIEVVNTAEAGAIQLRWYPGQPVQIYRWRETEKHFWFDG